MWLARGPVSSLEFAAREGRWLGQKQPACKLCLDAVGFHEAITRRRLHDDAFRTWVHESIHARQHFTSEQQRAEHNWPGYEEGLAEGLARLLTGHMDIRRVSFNVYIMQYETLAAHLNISVELLWRALWRYGPGQVRHHCPDVINQIVRQSAQGQLNPAKLRACCDQVFARRYLHDRTAIDDDGARSGMAQRWRRLLSWANTT